jgi:hypothetical protein
MQLAGQTVAGFLQKHEELGQTVAGFLQKHEELQSINVRQGHFGLQFYLHYPGASRPTSSLV